MFTLIEAEIKERLERTLHTRISLAEWCDLERRQVVAILEEASLDTAEENWDEFVTTAKDNLKASRTFKEEDALEQRGELNPASKLESIGEETAGLPDVPARLSDRTSARGKALSAVTRLRMGSEAAQKVMESGRARISSTFFPRGGVDGTIPQWVIIMAVEAWVPADDVKESYGRLRQAFLEEQAQPKTQARTFQVAAFVWDQEQAHGKRPTWPVLCERWNNWPLTEPFEGWRAFRMCYVRGEKATRPGYVASEEQLTELVRTRHLEGNLERWAKRLA
jgi:hypothetical protein